MKQVVAAFAKQVGERLFFLDRTPNQLLAVIEVARSELDNFAKEWELVNMYKECTTMPSFKKRVAM